jgi:catechol 2,3-dioxygenase-like lactoylglutathione lyase family enzyme
MQRRAAEKIAPAFVFLAASACSRFITVEVLPVIGGHRRIGTKTAQYPGQASEDDVIHHVSLGMSDLGRSESFYAPLMALIGFRLLKRSPTALHYGCSDTQFSLEKPSDGAEMSVGNGVHVAFQAPDRETVRRFHAAALECGGTDEGAPGIRANYNAHYYAAFVRDPDGNKIEAVTMTARESY